ncbi:MAG TPA: hypothetical protein VJP39_03665 [Gaiellaceae bacterium]|nr:hypothetical protein [Gaiellaceae bacterium]
MVVGLAVAGCGSGSKSPSVASLGGSNTTTSSNSNQSSGGGFSSGKGGGAPGFHIAMKGNLKFSQCMRSHGVSNFPDPNSGGQIGIDSASGLDPSSPAFQSAQKACRKYLPNGGQPTPQQLAKAKASALKFSQCMRAHGVKDYPDPNFSGGGVSIRIGGKQGSDLDPNNPTFKAAQTACRGDLPFKP